MSTKRHTLYNFSGAVVSLIVSLVTVPLYIHQVGEARYGVLAIMWLLLGYFGLFDLGLSRATAQAVAANFSAGPEKRGAIVWGALLVNLVFGALGGLILLLASHWLIGSVLSVDPRWRGELLAVLPWIAVAVPVATTTAIFSGTLQGLSRFFELNVLSVFGTTLFQVLPLCAAYIVGPDLRWLIPAAVFARMISSIPFALICARRTPLHMPKRSVLEEVPALLRFGVWITGNNIIGPLLDGLDRMLIGAIAGAQAVSYYVVPMSLAQRMSIIPSSIGQALFPRYAMAADHGETRSHAQDMLLAVGAVLAPATCAAVAILPTFLTLWIGSQFAAKASLVGEVLLAGMWMNCLAQISLMRLQAIGRPDLALKFYLVELVPYAVCLLAGLFLFGVSGAALAWAIRAGVDMIFLSVAAKFDRAALAKLVPLLSLIIVGLIIDRLPIPLAAQISAQLIILALATYASWLALPAAAKLALRGIIGSAGNRLRLCTRRTP